MQCTNHRRNQRYRNELMMVMMMMMMMMMMMIMMMMGRNFSWPGREGVWFGQRISTKELRPPCNKTRPLSVPFGKVS